MVDGCWETSRPFLLSNYKLKDICNTDEFGLLYTFQIKPIKLSLKSTLAESWVKYALQAW